MSVLIGVGMLALLFTACSGDDHGSPSFGAVGGSTGASEDAPGGASEGGRGLSTNAPSNSAGSGAEEPETDPDAEPESPESGGAGGVSSLDGPGGAGGEIGSEEANAGDGSGAGGEPSTSEGGCTTQGGAMASAGTGGASSAGQSSVGGRHPSAGSGGTPSASAGAGAGGMGFPVGDALEGELIELDYGCRSCHGDDFSGAGIYPNLTPDLENGIGAWSDAQIARAIRNGQNEADESLCSLMPRYPFTDQKVAHIIAYLRSFPPSSKKIGQVCPGHGR